MARSCKVWCPTAIEQEVTGVPLEGYNPFFFPDEGDYLLFRFTQESFLRVFSSLQNGAYITYGDEGRQVIWDFLVNVEYPVSICDAIINCITTNPATIEAIVSALKENEDFNDYISQASLKPVPGAITTTVTTACDNYILAGQIISAVNAMNQTNTDFLENVELGTNDEERVTAIISGIPGAGVLPADEILDFLQKLLEDFTEQYASAVTLAWIDEVSRDLYCIAKEDPECRLTFGQIFDYFKNRAGSDLTLGSILQNVFSFLINGDFSTDELVASGMFMLQMGLLVASQEFAGMSLPLLFAIALDAEPSNRWESWDPCPVEWCRHLDAANDLEALFAGTGGLGAQAVWTGTGWARNDAVAPGRITIGADMGATYNVTSIRIVRTSSWTGGDTNQTVLYAPTFATVIDSAAIPSDLTFNTDINVQTFQIDEVSSFLVNEDPIGGEITDIYITGFGTPPAWGEEC